VTRNAPSSSAGGENFNQRQRTEVGSDDLSRAVAFDDINRDCLVHILSFLPNKDLDTVAEINQDCRDARSDESLDQTRTGTIVCSENTTFRSLYNAIVAGDWSRVFLGNRKHLRIEGINAWRVADFPLGYTNEALNYVHRQLEGATNRNNGTEAADWLQAVLAGVISADFSVTPNDLDGVDNKEYLPFLFQLLPNLKELDLSHVRVARAVGSVFFDGCPNLTRLTWKGSLGSLFLTGSALMGQANLTELVIDDSRFLVMLFPDHHSREPRDFEVESTNSEWNYHMLIYCHSLERASI